MFPAKLVFLPILAFFAAVPCSAQSPDEYRKMLDDAMKSGGPSGGQSVQWDARLKKISGEVLLKSSEAAEWVAIDAAEVPLDPDDLVKTGASGAAEIYIENQGVIALGRNTELEIRNMEKEDSELKLLLGSIVAKIEKFAMNKRKLSVRTPSAVCAVRGTEFAVEHSRFNNETAAAVFEEGSVSFMPLDKDGKELGEYVLEPNTEIFASAQIKRHKAVRLSRMMKHRGQIARNRERVRALRKNWKPLSMERRDAVRRAALRKNIMRPELDGPVKKKVRPARAKTKPARTGR
ncbi:MAG: hypothetical protein FD189_818 [Elusimicrobia bacterium]|nr:MAG: hypothetical protein FD154_811 [Elusimicrobiota bacterium]KAF0156845.1 MAG: hypothetical protein FD189_818 [Elusimicrobiota bacterium]